ncbi:hypothetical protein [Deinococcus multiflagellatus]|uniref:Uncharacterized protein n=1 Tax=Deinococcus multiflagellatus TaxID=1656887 RepID=A0ABW1ZFU2_9DEIO|nr:hypothetical protein [Deinococcus multiflagellatus]MBZ9712165.1 hypothetical protein [Deinococcus multiflagellatus]
MTKIEVTAQNIEDVRDQIKGNDLRDSVAVGQTVEILRHTPNQSGCTVIFNDDRAGIFQGGDSLWGDLDSDRNVRLDTGELLTLEGELVEE